MIRPKEIWVYLCYRCSKCKYPYCELRLKEALKKTSLRCPICKNIDQIEVPSILFNYYGDAVTVDTIYPTVKSTQKRLPTYVGQVKSILIDMGYSRSQANTLIKIVTTKYENIPYEDFIQKVLIEAANVK